MGTERDDGRILRAGSSAPALDLLRLAQVTRRPRLYAGRNRNFWADPYIAEHLLHAHLDGNSDDASRRPAIRERTIEAITAHAADMENRRLLDLGCGPGLYSAPFAAKGFQVTGLDLSQVALDYARKEAAKLRLQIDYRCDDIRSAPFDGPYGVIAMVYGGFGAISDVERKRLLNRVLRALAPGGLFVFDVFTESYTHRLRKKDDWYVGHRGGFWSSGPHLVLERTFHYRRESASLVQYTIIDEEGGYRQFNVWWRHFTREEIVELVTDAGFEVEGVYGSLGKEPYDRDREWIALYCRAG